MGLWKAFKKDMKTVERSFGALAKRASYVSDKSWICDGCDYQWITKKSIGCPAKCPRCNSKKIRKATSEDIDWSQVGIDSQRDIKF